MLISRSDRGLLASWWYTVDRALLSAVLLLMGMGLLALMAASPPVAERLGRDTFHFLNQQLLFLAVAIAVMFTVSFFNVRWIRRCALLTYVVGLLLMLAALKYGPEIKGAHRWIDVGPLRLQPSEFVKPAATILAAWLLGEWVRRPDMPGLWGALGIYAIFAAMLLSEPDLGQTILISLVFGTVLLVAGIAWIWVLGIIGIGAGGLFLAYMSLPHVASRIDRFLNPDAGDSFQVDKALEAFQNGGFAGTGPGAGMAKHVLPDAHTDFIFAVVGEEFGIFACALIILVIGFVVMRLMVRAIREEDPFVALALTGLGAIFGFQAAINMMVNVALVPAKGMTLPFISYGGSSLVSMAITMGAVLALSRKRPVAHFPVEMMQAESKP